MAHDKNWLAAYLKNPQKVIPSSRMHNFHLMDSEVSALVAYLSSLGGVSYSPQAPKLFADNCTSCHKFHGDGAEIGPDLSHIAQARDAAYIAAYIKNSKKINPDSAMQTFEDLLNEQQRNDIAQYLFQRGK